MNHPAFGRLTLLALMVSLCLATGAMTGGPVEAQSIFPEYLLKLLPFNAVPRQAPITSYLISVGPDGEPMEVGTGAHVIDITPDGRYVVFAARPGFGTSFWQAWIHDRLLGLVRCVSLDEHGDYTAAICIKPTVSNDGRYVAYFEMRGHPGQYGTTYNMVVHDTHTGTTVSLTEDLTQWVTRGEISGDGTTATYEEYEQEYVSGNRVYRHNIAAGTRQGMPRLPDEGHQLTPSISDDGSVVAYLSDYSLAINGAIAVPMTIEPFVTVSTGSVSGDGSSVAFGRSWWSAPPPEHISQENGSISRYNVATGAIVDVSGGVNAWPFNCSISSDGRYVVFCGLQHEWPHSIRNLYLRDMSAGSASLLLQIEGIVSTAVNADGRFVGYHADAVHVLDRLHDKLEDPTELQVGEVEAGMAAQQEGPDTGELLLSWLDNSTQENAFQLHVRRAQLGSGDWEHWEWLAQVGQNVTSYRTGQIPSGRYQFRVRAINTVGLVMSEWCLSAPFDLGEVDFPLAPTNLRAEMVASDSVDGAEPTATLQVTWQDNSDNEIGFELQRSYREPQGDWGAWEGVAPLDADSTETPMVVPLAAGDYRLQMRALGTSGDSPWTLSPIFAVTPPAPYGFAVAATGPAENGVVPLGLDWLNFNEHRHRFDLQWRRVLSGQFAWSEWEEFDYGLSANLREWTAEAALEQAATYQFRIRAGTVDVHSAWVESNVLDFRPEAPAQLAVTMSGSNSLADPARATFAATWWDLSDNEDGFELQRRRRTVGPVQAQTEWSEWVLAGYSEANTEQATFDLPLEPADYQFRISSFNNAGASEWEESPAVACELPTPELLAASLAGESGGGDVPVLLSWEYPQTHIHRFDLQTRRFSIHQQAWTEWSDEETGIGADRREWDSGVDPLTYSAYQWRLRATGAGMNSYWNQSNVLELNPEAPANVEGRMIASTSVPETPVATLHVTWEDNSDDETGFEIEVYHSAGAVVGGQGVSEWTPAGAAPANSTEAQVQVGLLADQCKVRVRSVHQAGASNWEESYYFSLQPPAPTDLVFGREGPLLDPEGDPHFVVPLNWEYGEDHTHAFRIESRRMDVGSAVWTDWGEEWGFWNAEWSQRAHDFAVWPPAGGIAAMQWRIRAAGPVPSEWSESGVINLVPQAPTNLQVTMIASDSEAPLPADNFARLHVTWEDNSANEYGFALWMRYRYLDLTGAPEAWGDWEPLRNFLDDATEGTVDIPLRRADHQLRLCARGSGANSEWAESALFDVRPPAPSNVQAEITGPTAVSGIWEVRVSWNYSPEHRRRFESEARHLPSGESQWTEWRPDGAPLASGQLYYDSATQPEAAAHQYRVRAICNSGESDWIESEVYDWGPEAPSNLQVAMIASDGQADRPTSNFARLRVTWRDNSHDETGFELWMRHREPELGPAQANQDWGEWARLEECTANSTEATPIIPLLSGDHQLRLCATGVGGASHWTTSGAFDLSPPAPENVRAQNTGPANEEGFWPIRVSWDYSPDHRRHVVGEVRYLGIGQNTWTEWLTDGQPLERGQLYYDTASPSQMAAYQYRVRATCYTGDSEWVESPVLDMRPAAPTNLVATVLGPGIELGPGDVRAPVQLDWECEELASTFRVEYRHTLEDSDTWSEWQGNAQTYGENSIQTETRERGKRHQFRVQASNASGSSDWCESNVLELGPATPTSLVATMLGPGIEFGSGDVRAPVQLDWECEELASTFRIEYRHTQENSDAWSEWQGNADTYGENSIQTETRERGKRHQFRVQAINHYGSSDWCESNVLELGPAPPTNLVATVLGPGIAFGPDQVRAPVQLDWECEDLASTFRIEYRHTQENSDTWSEWQGNADTYGDNSIQTETRERGNRHQFRVQARNHYGSSDWCESNVLELGPAPPTNLVATLQGPGIEVGPGDVRAPVQLDWECEDLASTFRVEYRHTPENSDTWSEWQGNADTYGDNSIQTETRERGNRHQFRVQARNHFASSDWCESNVLELGPATPTTLVATVTGPADIPGGEGVWRAPVMLTWECDGIEPDWAFRIEHRHIPEGEGGWSEWAINAQTGSDTSMPTETRGRGSRHQFRVQARSPFGPSGWCESNIIGLPPEAPVQVTLASHMAGDGRANLRVEWRDNSRIERGFELQHRWRPWMGDAWSAWAPRTEVGADITRYDDPACEAGTHQYRVRAINDGGSSEWAASLTHLLALPGRGVAHFTSYDPGLSMVSLPVRPHAENLDPATIGCDQDSWARWRPGDGLGQGEYAYWVHDPQGYASLADGQQVPGRGYWARFPHSTTVGVEGEEPAPDREYVIQIGDRDAWRGGWVQIGNPRLIEIPWTAHGEGALKVRRDGQELTLAEARAAGWCEDFAWGYEAGGPEALVFDPAVAPVGRDDSMKAWRGYWFLAHGSCQLVVPPVSVITTAAALTRPAAQPLPGDWTLRLIASVDGATCAEAVVGQAMVPRQIAAPPQHPHQMQLAVVKDGNRLGVDLGQRQTTPDWELEILSVRPGAQVTLSWPDMTALPHGFRPLLVDRRSGKRTYMRTSNSYSFSSKAGESGRRLQLVMAAEDEAILVVSGVVASALHDGGAQLRLHLSAPAALDVDLLNMGGRVVASICRERITEAGVSTLHWNGRGNTNTKLPGGRYVVRVTARSDEGQQTSALTTLQIGM